MWIWSVINIRMFRWVAHAERSARVVRWIPPESPFLWTRSPVLFVAESLLLLLERKSWIHIVVTVIIWCFQNCQRNPLCPWTSSSSCSESWTCCVPSTSPRTTPCCLYQRPKTFFPEPRKILWITLPSTLLKLICSLANYSHNDWMYSEHSYLIEVYLTDLYYFWWRIHESSKIANFFSILSLTSELIWRSSFIRCRSWENFWNDW